MWDGPRFQLYYDRIGDAIRERLAKERPEYLLQVNPEEYLEYLVAEAEWQPLQWDESRLTVEPFTAKKSHRDPFRERTYMADESYLRLRIPLSPHPQRNDYFKFGLSTTTSTGEPDWKFDGDVLVYEVEATEAAVKRGLEAIRFWLGGRNKDIEEGNKRLRERIRPVWEAKRKQLEEQHSTVQGVLQRLNIP